MKIRQTPSRPFGYKLLLLAIIAVVMSAVSFSMSAPPRRAPRVTHPTRRAPVSRTPSRRTPLSGRPAAARRPSRLAPAGWRNDRMVRRRIGTLSPVVVGGTGGYVVTEADSPDVVVVPVPTQTSDTGAAEESSSESASESEGDTAAANSGGESGTGASVDGGNALRTGSGKTAAVPSDADGSMADSPSYKVVGVEDDGLTIVVDVDGQRTPVRMIGLAEPQQKGNDKESSGAPMGRKGPGRDGPPRLPTGIFLENMLNGEDVYIVYDSMVEDQDEDGKYVAYVYRAPDGMLLNSEVIRQGFAVVDPGYDFAEKDTFLYYQNKAQQARKGLWGKGPRHGQGPRRGNAPPDERR